MHYSALIILIKIKKSIFNHEFTWMIAKLIKMYLNKIYFQNKLKAFNCIVPLLFLLKLMHLNFRKPSQRRYLYLLWSSLIFLFNTNVTFTLQATFLTVIIWIWSPNPCLLLHPFRSAVIRGEGSIEIVGQQKPFFPTILPSQKFGMYTEVERIIFSLITFLVVVSLF